MTIEDFPSTRSGRKVVPPLAHWANQRKVYYRGLDATGVIPGTVNTLSGISTLEFREDAVG